MAIDIIQGMQEILPTGVAGLVLWLDASDNSTITLDGPGDVSQWDDKSGSGNDFTSAVGDRPTYSSGVVNGLNALEFDTVNEEFMTATTPITGVPFTIFLVGSVENVATTEICIYDASAGGSYIFTQISRIVGANFEEQGLLLFREPNNPGVLQGGWPTSLRSDAVNGTVHISVYQSEDGIIGSAKVNNSPVHRDDAFAFRSAALPKGVAIVPTNLDTIDIGRFGTTAPSSYMTGKICELIIYNQNISDKNRLMVSNYLANKWGINLL